MLKVLKTESESRKGVRPGSRGGSLFLMQKPLKMNINRPFIEMRNYEQREHDSNKGDVFAYENFGAGNVNAWHICIKE